MHKFDITKFDKLDNPERRASMPPLETLAKFGIGDIEGAGRSGGAGCTVTLLDIGCGIGYFTIAAAELLKDGKVIGIDISEEILSVARDRSRGADSNGNVAIDKPQGPKNIEFRKCEEYLFPVEDQSMDYAFICNVLHEIEDKPRYLKEIRRVLKREGFLCLIEWQKRAMPKGPGIGERISMEEVIALAQDNNFEYVAEVAINEEHFGVKLNTK